MHATGKHCHSPLFPRKDVSSYNSHINHSHILSTQTHTLTQTHSDLLGVYFNGVYVCLYVCAIACTRENASDIIWSYEINCLINYEAGWKFQIKFTLYTAYTC